MSRLALVVVALAALCAPAAVSAQQSDDELARHFFETGRTYFDRAEYDEAAEAFAEAHRLSGRPELLVNQARALEAAGDIEGAIAALERAEVELEPDSDVLPTVAPRLGRLRNQLEQQRAEAARREAEAAEGHRPDGDSGDPAPPAESAADEGPGTMFWIGVGVAGLGAAALITSLATGLAAHGIYGDLETACRDDVCPPNRAGDIDRGSALSGASTAMLFVGAVAAAAGVTLIILDGAGGEDEARAMLRLGPTGLLLDGRF